MRVSQTVLKKNRAREFAKPENKTDYKVMEIKFLEIDQRNRKERDHSHRFIRYEPR